ncbi:signal peptide peptidase SppA [Candidatus Sumerlaeota bacterium]|nr:signal peptide peptidase SppA [Candidatus Sumerlaeota bacterium]
MSRSENTVGLVRIENVILDDRRTLDVIDYYARKKGIQAVLVRIDSPGGGVGASQEIYEAILRLRDDGKSVVVSMGSMAASGGYYVACAADEVFTNPGTLTGSIGVIIGIPNFKKIADKIGFEYQVVKSGKFKDIASTTRPLTDEERELMQGLIDDVYNQFLEAILENRTPQIEKALAALDNDELTSLTGGSVPRSAEAFLRAIADGRILTGRQAVRYGLVDYEGTQQEALDRVAELAGLEEPELYEYKPRRPLSELFEAGAKSALENTGLPIHGMRIEYRLPY